MRLKLYKFDKVGHYVADDTLVINVCYGEVGNYGAGDTQTQSTQKSSQSQPWKESTIKLLQFQQNGNVTRFSAQMIRLAIYLLVACNLSANCIPLVICGILNAAEFKNLKLPKYGYFRKIRSALAYLNRARMLKFCSDATEICICFDGTSLSTKQGGVFGLTVMNEKAQNHLIAMIEHNEKADGEPQHVLDVRMIIQTLKNTFGESFESIIEK